MVKRLCELFYDFVVEVLKIVEQIKMLVNEIFLVIVGCVIFNGVFMLIFVLLEEEFEEYGIIFEF